MERTPRVGGDALPIIGIVAAAIGALSVSVLTGFFVAFVVFAVMTTMAVFLFKEPGGLAKVLGAFAALDAFLALLYFAPLRTGGQTFLASIPEFFQDPWLATLLTFGVAYVALARRHAIQAWVLYVGGVVAIARIFVAAMTVRQDWGSTTEPLNLVGLVLGLLLLAPPILAFLHTRSASPARLPPPAPAPPYAPPPARPPGPRPPARR